jgi:hypothetical protein
MHRLALALGFAMALALASSGCSSSASDPPSTGSPPAPPAEPPPAPGDGAPTAPSPEAPPAVPCSCEAGAANPCTEQTPIAERPSSCYLREARAAELLDELTYIDQALIWNARNFAWAADPRFCDPTVPPFSISREELLRLSAEGHRLHDGGREIGETRTVADPSALFFLEALARPNRRYPGRSEVYKPKWERFKRALDAYMAVAGEVDGRSPLHDGIKHWCQTR